MAGPLILVVGSIAAALATSLDVLLAARFVQGIGSGIYMTVSSATIATLAAPSERGRLMALYQGGMLLGTGLGPAIGGMLAIHFGYSAPFWAYAVVCMIALVIAWSSSDLPGRAQLRSVDEPTTTDPPASARSAIRQPAFLLACMINFGVFFTRTASQWQAIPLLAHERYGMGVDKIGLALTLLAAMNFLTLPLTGALIDRYGARRVTFVSTMVTALSLVWIGLGEGVHMMWIGMAMLGVGGGLNGPATAAFAAESVPIREYGPAMGLMRTFGDAGFVFGPILIGAMADLGSIGPVGGLLTNAVLMAVAGLAFASIRGNATPLILPAPVTAVVTDPKKDPKR